MPYAHIDQSVTGVRTIGTAISAVTVECDDKHRLPPPCLDLSPTRDITVRFALARIIIRPSLGNLTPGGLADSFSHKVSFGNPQPDLCRATDDDAGFELVFRALLVVLGRVSPAGGGELTGIDRHPSTDLPTSLPSPGSPAAQNPVGHAAFIGSAANHRVSGAGTSITITGGATPTTIPSRSTFFDLSKRAGNAAGCHGRLPARRGGG